MIVGLSERGRAIWWVLVVAVLGFYLYIRWPDLRAGHAVPFDAVIALVWLGLILAPLFSEVSLFGVTMKREIEKIDNKVDRIQTMVASLDIQNTFSPQVVMPAPDSQLKDLEETVRGIVASEGLRQPNQASGAATPDERRAFETRLVLEREVNRIAASRGVFPRSIRTLPFVDVARTLRNAGIIEPEVYEAIREVWAITSQAIHGHGMNETQSDFLRTAGPALLTALSRLQ